MREMTRVDWNMFSAKSYRIWPLVFAVARNLLRRDPTFEGQERRLKVVLS